MLDINLIREKPEWVKQQIAKLNDSAALERIDKVLELDEQRRELLKQGEEIQFHRNRLNKKLGELRGNKKIDELTKAQSINRATRLIELASKKLRPDYFKTAVQALSGNVPYLIEDTNLQAAIKAFNLALEALDGQVVTIDQFRKIDPEWEEYADSLPIDLATAFKTSNQSSGKVGKVVEAINDQLRGIDAALEENMYWVPNMPHESVPVFESDEHNIPWPPEGHMPSFSFEPKPHWELGPELGIIDFERGVKLAGSRAYVLKGWGARLQRALVSFYLDSARAHGFTQVNVPYFVKEEMMYGAGQFPKFRDVVYFDPDAEVYMLPTAEVAITNLHRDEILDESQLPLHYVAHTPCFRREKTSAGRDVRGIKRVHQFEKVEMYKFTTPETSYAELEALTEAAADICRALKLHFRRLEIVTGDLGFSASKKYDLEVWSPGCKEWLEVSSCSNTEAFQARRANVKYRPSESKKAQFVHTLNGSGLADTRVIIAILENYQQADGSVVIPEVLRPYMGGADLITKA